MSLSAQGFVSRSITEESKPRPKEINYIQYEHSDNEDNNSFVPENFEKIDIHSSL